MYDVLYFVCVPSSVPEVILVEAVPVGAGIPKRNEALGYAPEPVVIVELLDIRGKEALSPVQYKRSVLSPAIGPGTTSTPSSAHSSQYSLPPVLYL